MRDLAVIVPAYDEAVLLPGLLAALAAQTDRDFTLVVVDNGSTDGTAGLAAAFPGDVVVLREPEPGAGTAADTGFRHAIAGGATRLLRTDADCLPARDWVATARGLLDDAELVCGRSVPRRDERPTVVERHVYPAVVRLAARWGRRQHRGPAYRCPFVLVHGHNLAITAELYQRCGGTPREALGAGPEDVTMLNRARRHSDRIVRAEHLVVESSLRRLRAWGARRTLLWHWDRRYRPAPAAVHVR
jgi:glycosyltransferase involved in cell wall biosynthesis